MPAYHRVIPYPETLAWIGENALVAISHLKSEAEWPEPPGPNDVAPTPNLTSLPESQSSLLTISWDSDSRLLVTCVAITSKAHSKAIHAVAPARLDDNITSYITGGKDKALVSRESFFFLI